MARIQKKTGNTGRREFLAGTGTALFYGTVAQLTGYAGALNIRPAGNPVASRVEHDSTLCAGCGVCGFMCLLYHEKEINVLLSRSEISRNPFEGAFSRSVCLQCPESGCYHACPLKDVAFCMDRATGVKYIDAEKCDGCGKCVLACPMQPARVKLNPDKKVAFKCDLCRGREKGPVCVEYCGQHALAVKQDNGNY